MNLQRPFSLLKTALRQVCALALLVMAVGTAKVHAQVEAITSWTLTSLTNGTDSVSGGITYLNKYLTVDTFTTAGGTYFAQSSAVQADHVYIRRNTTTESNAFGVMSTRSGSNTIVHGSYYATAEAMLLSGNILNTTADTFTNINTETGRQSNVERIDFVWSSGYTVLAGDVLSIFNVDPATAQDDFRIAVFTSLGTVNGVVNSPTAYATTGLLVNIGGGATGDGTDPGTAADYGPLLPVTYPTGSGTGSTTSTTSTWNILDYTNGDNLSGTGTFVFQSASQGIGGAAIKLSDLGILTGQTIFGYSIMAPDVIPTVASDLVNWQNAAVYLTDTDTPEGTADFSTFGGRFIRPIPEPSTYGAIFLGAGLVAYGLRRRLDRRA
jgi:hypothetical protein